MLILHTMPITNWGLLSPSPFCLKTEVYLRMIDAPYTTRPTLLSNRAPRGKLPWIEDNGHNVADSEAIVAHLRATRGDVLGEAALSRQASALAHLVRRTMEESFYFALVSERWRDPTLKAAYSEALLSSIPKPARWAMAQLVARMLLKQLWQQGYGRHDLDTVIRKGRDDIDAVAVMLGDAPYVTGDTPHAVDATLFAFLANAWYIPVESRLKARIAQHPNLVSYLERMRARYVPELAG